MRIVAGLFGGPRLEGPPGLSIRPTGEQFFEGLFRVLGATTVGARVADLFAGTGALGLEALSRGAATVDFFESGRQAGAVLRRNIAALGVEAVTAVHGAPLPRGLSAGTPWDLVLLDPPWGQQLAEPAVVRLVATGRLAPSALVVVEERRGAQPAPAAWRALGLDLEDARDYGDTSLVWLRVPAPALSGPA